MKKLILLSALLLTACGFQPIYGQWSQNPETASAMNSVSIASIPDRIGQKLRNHLIDRMYLDGRPKQATTRLEITLHSTETDLGLQKDATTTRQELNLRAVYILKDLNDKPILKGEARSIVGYNKLEAQYATVAAKQNAVDRALIEVGEQIVNRMALFFAEKQDQPAAEAPLMLQQPAPTENPPTPPAS